MINNKNYSTIVKRFFGSTGLAAFALAAVVVPSITHADTLTRYLGIGDSGSDVSSVQTFLAADPSLYPQGLVTGYFGSLTKSAVANFQRRNGISAVGRIGPATLPVINAQMSNGSTVGFDRRAPMIGGINITVAQSSANLSWNTDEGAAALVYYSTSPIMQLEASEISAVTLSGSVVNANTNLQTSHSAVIAGLQPNTTYNYVVYVRDGQGNESVTYPAAFRTTN